MHPVIRIVFFLVFGLSLSWGGGAVLLFASLLVLAAYLYQGNNCFRRAWPMLRRMRWFFASILLIYFWLTPGQPVVDGVNFPTWDGVTDGCYRVAVLVVLVLSVQLLILTTERNQFVSAIYWLALPLIFLGISRERLAVRIALVMALVVEAQSLSGEARKRYAAQSSRVLGLAKTVADLVLSVVARANERELSVVELTLDDAPPLWQWGIPVALLVFMLLLSFLVVF